MSSRPYVTIDAVALANRLVDGLEMPGGIPDDARARIAIEAARETGYTSTGHALAELADVIFVLAYNQAPEGHSVGDVIAALAQPEEDIPDDI